ncbi:MAG: TonB-dependent siderophore receptor [Verrucomicrobia bacterium]|nr:TonB-dependent siderophore receptor [Verrucomicrobiota bacterium]
MLTASALAQTTTTTTTTSTTSTKADDDKITHLTAFEVKDTQDTGYTAKNAISGSKTSQPLENLAGAYSVVTRDLLDDLGAIQNAPEGVRYVVPGVTPFVKGDQYMIRGRRSGGTADDGVPSVIFFADSVGIDSIEVMKGPQAVLYGQQAGIFGNVLRVSKKPLPIFRGSVTGYYGSDEFKRMEVDVTGPLTHGFSYRVIGAYQKAGGYLKNSFDNREVGMATLQWKGPTTTVRLRFEHQDLQQRGDNIQLGTTGQVFNVFEGAGRNEGFFPKWGHYEDIGNITRLNVIQDFGEHVQSRLSASRAKTFRDYIYLLSPTPNYATNTFTQDYFNYAEDFEAKGLYFDNVAKFDVRGIPLQTNFGYTWDKFTPLNFTRNYIPKYFTGNLYAPDYSNLLEPRTSEGATGIVKGAMTTATSLYILQTVELFHSRLILSAGAAYNKSVVESQDTGVVSTNQGEWVKRAGIVFKPVSNVSLYYGYATMFNPSSVTTLDINGNPLPVITGIGKEVGIKTSFLDGRLSLSLDYYKLERTNISVFTGKINSRGLGYYELVGAERSKGWEFEAHAQLTKSWELVGVAWKGDSLDRTGTQFFNSLKESAGFFTNYTFGKGSALPGFSIGGGSYAQGRRYFGANAAAGFFTHTAFIGYKFDQYSIRLNVENLTDEHFVSGAWSQGQVSGSTPRSYRLMAEMRF